MVGVMRVVVFAFVVACGAAVPESEPARLSAAPRTPWESATFAQSNATTPAPTTGLAIIVSQTAIVLGDGTEIVPLPPAVQQSHGIDAAYKRSGANDLFVVPLANALHGAHEARLAVDPRVPYRVLVEVLFTLGQSEVTVEHLIVRSGNGFATIDPILPHAPSANDSTTSLNLLALIVDTGIGLKARGGNIAPGCNDVAAGVSIPKKDGKHDFAELARCSVVLKGSSPDFASEKAVTVTTNPGTDFQTIVSTLDALRPAFPDVTFGIAR
jgi:hypothetical protein